MEGTIVGHHGFPAAEPHQYARSIADAVRDPLLVLDGHLRVVAANSAYCSTFAVTPQQTEGRPLTRLGNGQWNVPRLMELLRGILPADSYFDDFELEHDFPAIGRRIMLLSARRERQAGKTGLVLLTIEDVTERKQVEEALRESERRYRLLAENATDVIWATDMGLNVTYASPSVRNLLGYSPEEAMALRIEQILTPSSVEQARRALRDALSTGDLEGGEPRRPQVLEVEMKRRDGSTLWAELQASFMRDHDGWPIGIQVSARDISERRQRDERLRAAERRLRSLASQLSLAEERERRRLATSLHDQVGQTLAVIKLKLGALFRALSLDASNQQAVEIVELVDRAIAETRSLTFDLSPPILYELGLEAALQWLVEQAHDAYGLACRFEDDGRPKPLGDDARGLLFRITRELLMNVIKHARAHAAVVSVRREGNSVMLSVEDDGVGFDIGDIERKNRSFGLFSIRERLTQFGGRLDIESAPGRGTRVTLTVPADTVEAKGPAQGRAGATIRVLLADDHRLMREGLRALLQEEADIVVAGEADNGCEAVEMAADRQPDVVVMDISMPGMNGIEATRRILAHNPAIKVLALSMHCDKRFVAGILTAGASGYLLKDCALDELVRAIRAVVAGQTYLSPRIAGIMVKD